MLSPIVSHAVSCSPVDALYLYKCCSCEHLLVFIRYLYLSFGGKKGLN
jgi:hypothetical protein